MTDATGTPDSRDRESHWAPYRPADDVPWDIRRVVHLHRRAGFAAPWDLICRDLKDGPESSVNRVLGGQVRTDPAADEFESRSSVLADAAAGSADPNRLKAWWIWRMLHTPDPLGERLTLLWHNHFATSNVKVKDPAAMRLQNETFRRLARAPFGELLNAVVRDPALLIWLDAPANRKGHPNENLARELMELFTVGIGGHSESDVREAARALTGWSVAEGHFHEVDSAHDDGPKTLLGRRGNWSARDLIAILLDQPGTAERLAGRICECFMGEGVVSAEERRALADGLRAHDLDVGWAVGTVLRSRAFFAEANIGSRVMGPAEFVVGAVAALEVSDASTLVLADWVARLGSGPVLPAERRRLAWRPKLAGLAGPDRPRQLRDGPGRGLPDRLLGAARRGCWAGPPVMAPAAVPMKYSPGFRGCCWARSSIARSAIAPLRP